MSRHVFIRPAMASDVKSIYDWSVGNLKSNGLTATTEMDCLKYPSTTTFCAYDESGPLAYLPIQKVLMMETFAPRPGLTELQQAQVLKEFVQATVTHAHQNGIGEIYYLGSDEKTDSFARHNVYEYVPLPVFRIKLHRLIK